MIDDAIRDEIEILALFNLGSQAEGIKVHHDAPDEKRAAAKRLYDKGMITQVDGGYLTNLGWDAAEQAQKLLTILTTPQTVNV